MNPPPQEHDPALSERLDRVFADFVLATERGDPRSRALAAWLEQLEPDEQATFVDRVALYLGFHGDRGPGLGSLLSPAALQEAPVPQETPQLGSTVARFEIREFIAGGSRSLVFKAWDPLLERHVAIKWIRDPDPRSVERLLREARVLARLEHPGLVRLLEAGTHGATPFLVLEYVDGPNLSMVPRRPDEERAELARGRQLADTLAWLHERSVVHRDIKPSNVLLRPDGRVALGDFGLMRLLDTQSSLTGPLLGTPAYMAPELARAPQNATPATDVYSLACLLVERLSGLTPFDGCEIPAILLGLLAGDDPFPTAAWEAVPTPLQPTLRCCLEHAPLRRPPARALAEDLAAWLAGRSPRLGTRTVLQRVRRRIVDRRRLLAFGGASALVAFLGWRLTRILDAPTDRERLAEAIRLVFDTGDVPSVLDPVTESMDGCSPMASLFLRKVESEWERERTEQADTELAGISDENPDTCLLRAALACRYGRFAEVDRALGAQRDSVAGLALRAEATRQGGDAALAAQTAQALPHQAPGEATAAFFWALASLASIESSGSPLEKKSPPSLLEIDRTLEQVVEADGPWSGWAWILATQTQRLQGRTVAYPGASTRARLRGSFWLAYLEAVRTIQNANHPIESLPQIEEAARRHPQSRMLGDLAAAHGCYLTPDLLDAACRRHYQEPDRSVLIHRICHAAFRLARFGPGPNEIEGLARSWLQEHPDAVLLWLPLATLHVLGLRYDDPGEVAWRCLENHAASNIRCQAVLELRRVPPPEPASPEVTLSRLAAEFRQSRTGEGAARVIQADVAEYRRLLSAAQAGVLPAFLDLLLVADPLVSACDDLCKTVGWQPILGPILERHVEDPANDALRLCLLGERALGPILVRHGDDRRVLESLYRWQLDGARQEEAAAHLRAATTRLAAASRSTSREKQAVAGAAFAACHLASLLRDLVDVRQELAACLNLLVESSASLGRDWNVSRLESEVFR